MFYLIYISLGVNIEEICKILYEPVKRTPLANWFVKDFLRNPLQTTKDKLKHMFSYVLFDLYKFRCKYWGNMQNHCKILYEPVAQGSPSNWFVPAARRLERTS